MLGPLLALTGFSGLGTYILPINYGTSDNINVYEINRARRKIHRAKMYRQYRHQPLRGMRVKAR